MGMKISKEWANNESTHFGITREQQLTSLWTKIFKHKESSGDKTAMKILEEAKKKTLKKVCLKSLSHQKESKYFTRPIKLQRVINHSLILKWK
jgi:hypothetical protein